MKDEPVCFILHPLVQWPREVLPVGQGAGRHDAAQLLRRGAAEVLPRPFEFSPRLRALLRLAAG
jgi:hypothetical protein